MYYLSFLFWWSEWESNPLDLCGLPSSGIALTRARPHPSLHIYYIIQSCFCQEIFEKYLQLFFLYKSYLVLNRFVSETNPSESVRTVLESIVSACPLFLVFRSCVPLLTLILYHKSGGLSRGFSKVFEKFFKWSFILVSIGS